MTASDTTGSADPPRLARSLGLGHAVLYGLGVTIGAGIYVLVGIAAGRAGMSAPLAFLAAAVMMAFSAASFAELGTRMPVSASEAAYVKKAFGREGPSLIMGLMVVATATVSAATITAGSAGYIAVFLPLPLSWIVAGTVVAMALVACLSTLQSVSFAGAMTLVEVGGLVLVIGAGLGQGSEVVTRLPEIWPAAGNAQAWIGIAGTALIAVFAFIGFEHVVNIAEEIREPQRTLPRALFLTLGLTALLYGLVAWIAVTAVPPAELARSSAPLALVFGRLTGLPLVTMSAIAVVATLNGIIVHMIMIARVLYGLADQGSLPRRLAVLNASTRTPILATLLGAAVILALALAVPLEGLANLTSQCTLLIFAAVNLSLIVIKGRETAPPAGIFVCPVWVPVAGFVSNILFLVVDLIVA